jgi:hypothetical protein
MTNEGTAGSLCVPHIRNSVELSFAVEEDEEEGENEEGEEKEEEESEEEDEEETAEGFQAQDINPLMGVQDLYIPTEVKITIVDKMVPSGCVLFDRRPRMPSISLISLSLLSQDKEVSSMSLACSAFESRFFIGTLTPDHIN